MKITPKIEKTVYMKELSPHNLYLQRHMQMRDSQIRVALWKLWEADPQKWTIQRNRAKRKE